MVLYYSWRQGAAGNRATCHVHMARCLGHRPVESSAMLSKCSRPARALSSSQPWPARRCRSIRSRSSCSRHQTLALPAVARPLLIDNYDSYSYNLYQILSEVYGVEPLVYYNDGVDLEQLQQLSATGQFQHIVLSPGPGHPATPGDIGVCLDILRHFPDTPVLGVCLGHQALGHVHGAAVVAAPEPVHGRLSSIAHNHHPLFKGIPSGPGSGFDVVRYHSLVVAADSLPSDLIPLAWAAGSHHAVELAHVLGSPADAACAPSGLPGAAGSLLADSGTLLDPDGAGSSSGVQPPSSPVRNYAEPTHEQQQQQQQPQQGCHVHSASGTPNSNSSSSSSAVPRGLVMALAHRSRPHYGVQFHPESVATKYGVQLLANFRDLAYQHMQQQLQPGLPQVMGVGPPGRCPEATRPWPPLSSSSTSSSSSSTGSRNGVMSRGSVPLYNQQQQAHTTAACASARAAADQGPTLGSSRGVHSCVASSTQQLLAPGHGVAPGQLQLAWRRLPGLLTAAGGSEALFEALCGPGEDTFWLDSASKDRARFSFMGCKGGPLWCRVLYSLPVAADTAAGVAPSSRVWQQHGGAPPRQQPQQALQQQQQQSEQQEVASQGTLCVWSSDGTYHQQQQNIWDYLHQQLSALQLVPDSWQAAAQLPFNFWGGFVGFLGYELKAECGGRLAHTSPAPDAGFFFADRLVVVDHHKGDVYLLAVSPAGSSSSAQSQDAQQQQEAWLQETTSKAAACGGQGSWPVEVGGSSPCSNSSSRRPAGGTTHPGDHVTSPAGPAAVQHSQPQPSTLPAAASAQAAATAAAQVPVQLAHSREQYLANVAACQVALHEGESYELCLTTALALTQPPEPWTYYQALRRVNPAPYGAWMQFGAGGGVAADGAGGSNSNLDAGVAGSHHQKPQQQQQQQQQQHEEPTANGDGRLVQQVPPAGLSICCSSPERFLQGGRGGLLEARPIKGTAPRSSDPVLDAALASALVGNEKDRAENLMIVDLLRNDLGRVCEVGSVHVPGLMELESHATVHQLVSTVRGLRKQGVSCVEAVRAAFPGGSMTGAPKLRSMQILDDLEGQARGVYSGALGYFSINDTFDLNIVIRTAVFQGGMATIGAGGAVVVQSEPQKEFEEMQLKAASLVAAAAVATAAAAEGGGADAASSVVGGKVPACAAG